MTQQNIPTSTTQNNVPFGWIGVGIVVLVVVEVVLVVVVVVEAAYKKKHYQFQLCQFLCVQISTNNMY